MDNLEKYPNLTNMGKGRPKGSKNKFSQEQVIKNWLAENDVIINWMKTLDYKIMNNQIRPEAIAPAIEKVAKYGVRTIADQDILEIVAPTTEDDVNKDLAEINQDLALIETLRKR
ncbi:hypothetical protein IFY90_004249 [Salmonella enterica]|nr:hypothetical protein [Salmonella enterica]